ncbi:MAG TPA: ABC transporter substrate-binding protein, partial [Candidatus Limnocylindrales bacterium]|nr:ABC transporter substrate-binding protein [Candidatus Limnocylindrales bacterium]
VVWSNGYLDFGLCMIVQEGMAATFRSPADLAGKRIAIYDDLPDAMKAGKIDLIMAGYVPDPSIKGVVWSNGYLDFGLCMIVQEGMAATFRSPADLAGKRIAIPSRFAVDFLFLRKMLALENMTPADLEIVEMPPPDMPAALYANAVDAYCTGEPFGAAAQSAGYARPLRMTRDEWRNYICCVLTVREELIASNRPLVQDLVNHVLGAGVWLDAQQENRNKAVAIAAGRKFFNQDPAIIRFVMENPVDRVTYGDLRMIRSEFEELMQLSIEAGTIKQPIAYEKYMDESFAKAARPATIAL